MLQRSITMFYMQTSLLNCFLHSGQNLLGIRKVFFIIAVEKWIERLCVTNLATFVAQNMERSERIKLVPCSPL
jgi:uncharacterized membrane protein